MKTPNKLNPEETFFVAYIAIIGLFLIIVVILLAFIIKPVNDNQTNKANSSAFSTNQKTINWLQQKQPIYKITQPPELPNQRRSNPFK